MTAVFAARRRAEEFARLLDDPRAASVPAGQRDLLDVVAALRATPAVEPRPEFVSDLRARLMDAADTLLVPDSPDASVPLAAGVADRGTVADGSRLSLPATRRHRDRRLAAAVGGLALVGATTSMAVAAQTALPGESLYAVKRAIENVHAQLTTGDADRGALLLADASGRLDEVAEVAAPDSGAGAGALATEPEALIVADTLDTFARQAGDAADLLMADYARSGHESSIRDLRTFDAASLHRLTGLEPLVPAAARDELMNAARTLFEIDAAAQQACPTCGGLGIHEIPGVLAPSASGTAPAVVPSSTLLPRVRPRDTHRGDTAVGAGSGAGTGAGTRAGTPGPVLAGAGLPPGGSGGTAQPAEDPTGELTETLTGGASLPTATASPDPLLPDTGKAIGDATTTVKDGLGKTLKDATTGDLGGDLTDPLHP